MNLSGAALAVESLQKRFGASTAVDGVSLDLVAGEHLALIGPSGCGKSTILLLIAGLLRPDGGVIHLGERTVAGDGVWVEPDRRRVGMVFQDYALFPHLTVAANIAFGLDRLPKGDQAARVAEVLGLVGLEELSGRYPHELSSGQQQRVALARSLAPEPDVILLDEPFSNLDRALRDNLRVETKNVLRRAGATAVLVTHDHSEALGFGDRVAVMRAGRILQVGTPELVFEFPEDSFVAGFLGVADFLPARRADGRTVLSDLGPLGPLPVPDAGELSVMVRPHELAFEPDPAGPATVTAREYQGTSALYELTLDSGERLASRQPPEVLCATGTRVRPKVVEGRTPAVFCDGRRIWPPGPGPDGDSGRNTRGEEIPDGFEMGVCTGGGGVPGGGLWRRQPGGRGQEPG